MSSTRSFFILSLRLSAFLPSSTLSLSSVTPFFEVPSEERFWHRASLPSTFDILAEYDRSPNTIP